MTAPFAPPPPPEARAILSGMLVAAIAIPFARREDWIGWMAQLAVFAAAAGMWALLIRGIAFRALQRRRRERRD